jgi:hypothetical protein
MKFSEIQFAPYNVNGAQGKTAKINCNNGYVLSVVQIFDDLNGNSYGAGEGLYEASLMKGGEMCYDTHITGFERKIIGFLSEHDVEKLIDEVDKL